MLVKYQTAAPDPALGYHPDLDQFLPEVPVGGEVDDAVHGAVDGEEQVAYPDQDGTPERYWITIIGLVAGEQVQLPLGNVEHHPGGVADYEHQADRDRCGCQAFFHSYCAVKVWHIPIIENLPLSILTTEPSF